MNLRHLKCFYWVSKLGSYSRASERLGITEPSVFRAVQNLQRSHRMQLLRRDSGRLVLTEMGRLLFNYAEKIDAFEVMAEQLLGSGIAPEFAFGSSQVFARSVSRCFAAWKLQHPDTCVGFWRTHSNDLYSRVLAGELAFGFGPIAQLPIGLASIEIGYGHEVGFLAKSDHPLCGRRSVSMVELARENFVTPFPTTYYHRLLDEIAEKAGVRFNVSVVVNENKLFVDLVAAGTGIALLSKADASEEIAEGKVAFLEVEEFSCWVPYGLVVREGASLSGEASSLLEHFRLNLKRELHRQLKEPA
ncbi:MAG: LysR family transcriptional regulator [Chloroflexi bacterium]|nr:LysR family transcriptional regulator [Chloroflexota bacterium]